MQLTFSSESRDGSDHFNTNTTNTTLVGPQG